MSESTVQAQSTQSQPIVTPAARAQVTATPTPLTIGKEIWDAWYTVTVGGKIPYAYYNDKVSVREGKLFFQNEFWKKEEGYINREQLGAVAEDDAALTPLFFNFRSVYRVTETQVDGTAQDGKSLLVKARRGGKELPVVRKSIARGTIFSVFFPLWVRNHQAELKGKKTISFASILEDDVDGGFSTASGRVRLDPPDEFAKKSGTQRYSVHFRDMDSVWHIAADGRPERIEIPAQRTLVQRTAKDKASRFLDE